MPMTNEEIVRYYRQAADKREVIQILADLNMTSRDLILGILAEAGEPVKRPQRRKRAYKRRFSESRALALYEEGLYDKDIAVGVGVHVTTICEWRRANGLPSNRQRKAIADRPRSEQAGKFQRLEQLRAARREDDGAEVRDLFDMLARAILRAELERKKAPAGG